MNMHVTNALKLWEINGTEVGAQSPYWTLEIQSHWNRKALVVLVLRHGPTQVGIAPAMHQFTLDADQVRKAVKNATTC